MSEDWLTIDRELRRLGKDPAKKTLSVKDKRIIELENRLKQVEKQRDRAEQKYDGACSMMEASPGPEGWEVITAADGNPSVQPVNWRERAEEAETALEALIAYRQDILDSAWNTANARAIKAEAELELRHKSCHELEDMLRVAWEWEMSLGHYPAKEDDIERVYAAWFQSIRAAVRDK